MSEENHKEKLNAVKAAEEAYIAATIAMLEAYIAFLTPYTEAGSAAGLSDDTLLEAYAVVQTAWTFLHTVKNSRAYNNPQVRMLYKKLDGIVKKAYAVLGAEVGKRKLILEAEKRKKEIEKLEGPLIPPFIEGPPKETY